MNLRNAGTLPYIATDSVKIAGGESDEPSKKNAGRKAAQFDPLVLQMMRRV